ncbi:MAG: hypothetical protein LBT60_01540, partial [Oscillospiraceae bacterium]|nr:hypothetical protein [Oscillospiraceae bacterium]
AGFVRSAGELPFLRLRHFNTLLRGIAHMIHGAIGRGEQREGHNRADKNEGDKQQKPFFSRIQTSLSSFWFYAVKLY